VCSDVVLPREEIAGLMGRLVDKSLVVFDGADFGDSRYRLLETMREYALERLSGAGGHVLRKRHALHYLERGRECERLYFDAQANAARVRYDADYINARAALEWSHGVEPELCLDIAAAWRFYWFLQGLLGEGRAWLELALDSPAGQDAARARALSGLGRLIAIQGDLERAIHIFSEGLLLAEHAGDDFMVGELTNSLGIATVDGAGNVKAEAYFRRAVEIWERVGYQEGLATAYGNLGEMAFYAGKHDEARGLFTKQVEMGREISRYYGWVNLSHLDCFLGNFRAARKSAAEALRVAPPLYAAVVIEVFAFLAAAQEQAERAATLSASAARLYAMRGARADPTAHREVHEARLREVIGRLDDRALAAARQRAAEMPLDEVTAYALAEA
jgi:non-specific serine/threonine protein kinase